MESFAPQFMVSKEQAERENRRLRSVYGGNYKFIELILNDIRRRQIAGVEVVHSTPFINEAKGGIQDYAHEIRGGAIRFEYNEAMGVWKYDMLDSEHNRNFLASMWDRNFWDIVDEGIKKDIELRAAEITASLIQKKAEDKENNPDIVGSLSNDMTIVHEDNHKKDTEDSSEIPPLTKTQDADTVTKRKPGRPATKFNFPDAKMGRNGDGGLVTVGTRVKQP